MVCYFHERCRVGKHGFFLNDAITGSDRSAEIQVFIDRSLHSLCYSPVICNYNLNRATDNAAWEIAAHSVDHMFSLNFDYLQY